MKKFITGLAYLLFPIVVTWFAAGFGNIFITIGAFIASIIVLAIIFRADIFVIVGTYIYGKDPEQGFKWFEMAMKCDNIRPRNQLFYAYLLIRNGYLDGAESIIKKTTYLAKDILKETELKNADFNLALISWKRGELNDAIMQMEELYADKFINGNLYGSLGYFYIANNEIEKAIEFSREGAEYDPENLIILDNLGQALIISGEVEEAEEIYQRIFEKSPNFIEPYYNYGTLLEKRGDVSEAKEYYEKALECKEKYLSTVKHDDVKAAIDRIDEILRVN